MKINKDTLPLIANYAKAGRVVVFDTETTGGSRDDEICQLAAAEYTGGKLQRTMNVYICPTCEMCPWAERVHGLSMDFLQDNGIAPEEALHEFFEFLGSDALLVAHNLPFDMGMLRRECEKFGVELVFDAIETCDTLSLSRKLRPSLQSHSLGHLLEALCIDGVNSHDALDDVMACAGVFFKLLDN